MNKMNIYNLAKKGLRSEELETKDFIFELIMKMVVVNEFAADVTEQQLPIERLLKEGIYDRKHYMKLSESALKEAKNKYSTYKGHAKLQLALDFFQMTNDLFFAVYGFNYVPEGKVRDAARHLIDTQALMNQVMSSYSDVKPTLEIGSMISPKTINHMFRSGC